MLSTVFKNKNLVIRKQKAENWLKRKPIDTNKTEIWKISRRTRQETFSKKYNPEMFGFPEILAV